MRKARHLAQAAKVSAFFATNRFDKEGKIKSKKQNGRQREFASAMPRAALEIDIYAIFAVCGNTDKEAIRLGFWEATRDYYKSIAVAAYGDTKIFKVETLSSSGIWVDASTCLIANQCYYTGTILYTPDNEKVTVKAITNAGEYIIDVVLGKPYVNNYLGMQYTWDSFREFYYDLNK